MLKGVHYKDNPQFLGRKPKILADQRTVQIGERAGWRTGVKHPPESGTDGKNKKREAIVS